MCSLSLRVAIKVIRKQQGFRINRCWFFGAVENLLHSELGETNRRKMYL